VQQLSGSVITNAVTAPLKAGFDASDVGAGIVQAPN